MIEKLYELVGDSGGYEGDFLYIASFISTFSAPLKAPQWTFVGLRSAFESRMYDSMLRDIMRRCFVLGGRTIIGGVDDVQDSKMDRALARLLVDKDTEASFLFKPDSSPDMSPGFLGLPVEQRTRLVRFLMQSVFDTPSSSFTATENPQTPVVGLDAEGRRYFLLVDTSLEVGCWRETPLDGRIELVATSTDIIGTLGGSLRNAIVLPDRSKSICIYCRKKVNDSSVTCLGCQVGVCHYKCLPAAELSGYPWCCSGDCKQFCLAEALHRFVEDIEPQQKAAMRKRRRLNGELNALHINAPNFEVDSSSRRSTRGRSTGTVDYSFRDYDKLMSDAIRKSERKLEYASSEEEAVPQARPMSREERMALRDRRGTQTGSREHFEAESVSAYRMDSMEPDVERGESVESSQEYHEESIEDELAADTSYHEPEVTQEVPESVVTSDEHMQESAVVNIDGFNHNETSIADVADSTQIHGSIL